MTDIDSTASRPRWFVGYPMATILALLYWCVAVGSSLHKSTTADEIVQLTGGYAQWAFHDSRIHAQNGSFAKRLAAIPIVLGDYQFPSREQKPWYEGDEDYIGSEFFYRSGNDYRRMLLLGRMMIALIGVVTAILIYAWARRLFSPGAGIVAMLMCVTNPNIIAWGRTIHADLAAMFFFALSTYAMWIMLHRVTPWTVIFSALAMAGLMVSKMSAAIIAPIGLILILVRLCAREPLPVWCGRSYSIASHGKQLCIFVATIIIHIVVCYAVIWAFFDFRYSAFAEGVAGRDALFPTWDMVLADAGPLHDLLVFVRDHRLLPEAYIWGHAQVLSYQPNTTFFLGTLTYDRPWYILPVCMLIKTPVWVFLLLVSAGAAAIMHWRQVKSNRRIVSSLGHALYRTAPLWTLAGVYWCMAIASDLNVHIGQRHNLPIYPTMFVLAGGAAWWLRHEAWRWMRYFVIVVVALAAIEAMIVWPNYIAYFSPVVGGSSQGYRYLVDTSLDYGQDLPALQRWLQQRKQRGGSATTAYVSFFGPDIVAEKPDAQALPSFSATYPYWPMPVNLSPLRAGDYCVSATILQAQVGVGLTYWSRDYEHAFRNMRPQVDNLLPMLEDPATREQIMRTNGEQLMMQLRKYELLRFARLLAYLRTRTPDEQINHSILVYRLNDEQVEAAMSGPVPMSERMLPPVK